jgi:DNA-binding transcriptional MerR regulator
MTVGEASKRYGIPENNFRYWMDNSSIPYSMESRGKRIVKVMLEEDIDEFLASRKDSHEDTYGDSSGEQTGDNQTEQKASLVLKHFQDQLEEKNEAIGRLQYQLGEATGRVYELEARLEDKDNLLKEKHERIKETDAIISGKTAEIMEWKRELAISKETKRNKWKWFWQR